MIELVSTDEGQKVHLDNTDVTEEIRTDRVSNQVSVVAKHRAVREEMVRRQQELGKKAVS